MFQNNRLTQKILILGSTLALTCSLMISCGDKGNSAQPLVGVRIASINNNPNTAVGTNSNFAFGNYQSLIVNVADDTGNSNYTINLNSTSLSGDIKQIGTLIYELQSRCVNQQCTDIAFLILARNGYVNPNSSFNSNLFGNQNSFGGTSVTYQPGVTTQYVTTTDVISSREFLYRATGATAGGTVWTLVRSYEDKTGKVKLLDATQINTLEQGT